MLRATGRGGRAWRRAHALIRFIDHVMRDVEHVRDATRVRHGLWPATFILGPRNTVLRPHFHRHPNDVIALLAQQITSDAGIDSAAHAKKHALFVSRIHPRKIGERLRLVNRHPEILICHPERKPRDPVANLNGNFDGIPRLSLGMTTLCGSRARYPVE